MLGITNKALAIAGGVIGVGTAGVGFVYLRSNNSESNTVDASPKPIVAKEPEATQAITALLQEDKRELLKTNVDDAQWNENWKIFKKKYNKDKIAESSWVFTGWEEALNGDVAIPAFKEKCNNNSNLKVRDNTIELYLDVKNYCTKAMAS